MGSVIFVICRSISVIYGLVTSKYFAEIPSPNHRRSLASPGTALWTPFPWPPSFRHGYVSRNSCHNLKLSFPRFAHPIGPTDKRDRSKNSPSLGLFSDRTKLDSKKVLHGSICYQTEHNPIPGSHSVLTRAIGPMNWTLGVAPNDMQERGAMRKSEKFQNFGRTAIGKIVALPDK